ncbi:MAG: hypothetical protein ACREON_07700 [Gemmatimonadaceae bacterium]
MRLELIPLLVGLLVAVIGVALIADAVIADGTFVAAERRSRPRPKRNRPGEVLLGVSVVLVAAVFIGRDTWRYTTVAIIGALLFFAAGLVLNWKYLRGLAFGPAFGRVFRRRASDRSRNTKKMRLR